MNEYKPLTGEVCGAVRWLASEVVLNKTATTCGFDVLLSRMPPEAHEGWNQAQVDYFRQCYENERMQIVMNGDLPPDAPGAAHPINLGFWPSYEWEREAGVIVWTGNPAESPWG